jgi:surfactin synthase thioesterase subunit
MASRGEQNPASWLLRFPGKATGQGVRQLQPRIRLICFSWAGGNAGSFRAWANILPPWVDFLVAERPGRMKLVHHKAASSVQELVSGYEKSLQALDPSRSIPLAFLGHSFGAICAYELAKALANSGEDKAFIVRWLFVSGRRAPSLDGPKRNPPVSQMPNDELVDYLSQLGGISAELRAASTKEFWDVFLPPVRDDYKLLEAYEYVESKRLPCAITCLVGEEDEEDDKTFAEPWELCACAEEVVLGLPRFQVREYPGDHFFINTAQSTVVRDVIEILERAVPVPAQSQA